jgi:RND family efflux transporter MFP subunit
MLHRSLLALACSALAGVALAQAPAAPAASAPEAASVRAQRYDEIAIQPQHVAPATVVPRNEARLAAEVAGRVLRWTADTGAQVARGALLVELDPTDMRLARDQARAASDASEARLALADKQMTRARELVAQGFFSQEALSSRETELTLARADLASARAQLASAERALQKTRIVAPFAASVKERLAQAGEYVAPGAALYVLTQTDDAEISAQVPLADVDSVRRSAKLEFVGAGGVRVPLKLARIAGTVTAPARTVEVRLTATQPIVVGAQGELAWRVAQPHLPASVLVRRDDRLGVFVVEAGKARFVAVPGAQEGRAAGAALPKDAQVITGGQAALRDGQPVAVGR